MVAVVSEIVSTMSAAENASSIFGTIPNLNFFIPLALSSVVGPPADTHREVYVRRRQRLIPGMQFDPNCIRFWFWTGSSQRPCVPMGERARS
jgi:hypothetical protein